MGNLRPLVESPCVEETRDEIEDVEGVRFGNDR